MKSWQTASFLDLSGVASEMETSSAFSLSELMLVSKLSRISAFSMTLGGLSLAAALATVSKVSSSGLSIAANMPGLVHI